MAKRTRKTDFTSVKEATLTIREVILNRAEEAIMGNRQLNYGKPEANFTRINLLWTAWFEGRPKSIQEEPLHDHEVAMLQILLKCGRLQNTPDHLESWTDIAGYAACGAEVAEAK